MSAHHHRHLSLPVVEAHHGCMCEVPMTPNEIAQALTGRTYLSYSQVSTFQSCPLKWWYSYVAKAPPETVHCSLLLGSGIHAAIQAQEEAELAGDPRPTVDQLMVIFQSTWDREAVKAPLIQYGANDTLESLQATAKQILQAWLDSPLSQPHPGTVAVEESLSVPLAPDLPDLMVRIDKLHVEEPQPGQNVLVVTDYKTTRSMWSPDTAQEHADQLILYAQAIQAMAQEFQATIQLRFVVLTKAKTPKIEAITIKPSQPRLKRTIHTVRQVFNAMQTGNVYPVPSQMNCASCPYAIRCESWQPDQAA
jgi:putative RecB family exonuclease